MQRNSVEEIRSTLRQITSAISAVTIFLPSTVVYALADILICARATSAKFLPFTVIGIPIASPTFATAIRGISSTTGISYENRGSPFTHFTFD